MKYAPALFAFVLLPGCSVIEAIFEGLAEFVDANDDGPRFVYVIDGTATRGQLVRHAAITPDDKGLILSSNALGADGRMANNVRLSPNAAYSAMSWDFFLFDVADFGIAVFNARTGARELVLTDNNITLSDELACKIPEFEELNRSEVASYIDFAFDEDVDLAALTFDLEIEDNPGNVLSFDGWTSDNRIVASYEYENITRVNVANPNTTISPDEWSPPRFIGKIIFTRTSGGTWDADACPAAFPPVVTVSPARNLTLSGGDIFLDGVELSVALGSGPLARGSVSRLSGAW